MRGDRGILQNLGILGFGQVAAQLLNVWALVFLAGFLGQHWFGVVQIGVAFMAYALITAEWGLFNLGIRETSRLDTPQEIFAYAREHTGMMLLQAVAVFGVGLLVLPLLPFTREDPVVFTLYLAAVLPQPFMQSWLAVGLERMGWVGTTKTARSLFYALAVLLILPRLAPEAGRHGARIVPAVFLGTMILGNLVIMTPVARWFGRPVLPHLPARAEMLRRWREAGPIGGGTVILRVLLNIDLILLGILADPEAAGAYAAAARIIFLVVVAVEVLWAALLPRLSRLWSRDREAFVRAFNLYLGGVCVLLVPVAVGGVLVGGDLIALLYRGGYGESGPIFRVLSVSYAMLAVGTFMGNALLAQDRQHRYLRPLVIAAVVAIAGNLLLVPRLGAVGAAWGMLASHAVLLVQVALLNRHLWRPALGTMLAVAVTAAAVMGLAVWAMGTAPVIARVAVGGLLYLSLVSWPALRFRARLAVPVPAQADTGGAP